VKVLLIGPPGSGKGTQGERLSQRLGLTHIAAGDLLRSEVKNGTPLGRQVSDMLRRGDLVPDVIVLSLVLPRVLQAAAAGGYLLDGFPRSVEQAVEARKLADQVDAGPDHVIYLEAPREVLMRRILERARVLGRDDDNEHTVENRLRVFDEATHPLVAYYRGRGLLRIIDAAPEVDEVTDAILTVLHGDDAAAVDGTASDGGIKR
jgi:adenylate kinase